MRSKITHRDQPLTLFQSWNGTVVRALTSHQCGLGSNLGFDAICGLSLLLVLSLAPRAFSTFPNSNSTGIRQTKNHFLDVLPPNYYTKEVYVGACHQGPKALIQLLHKNPSLHII